MILNVSNTQPNVMPVQPERNDHLPSINRADNCLVSNQCVAYDPSEVIND
jgi:hypothetical protein